MDPAQVSTVATAFTNHYYTTFSTDRNQLLPLYRDQSMLTFEGQQFQGANKIIEKLASLPFQKVQHQISTIDAQPNFNGIFVCVTGALQVDEDAPQRFAQAFQLIPEGTSYYVLNDIFRLNYG
ncbi:nuclear transport factor 2 [Gigaspora margarita]|uniref:Nuclear transport factor 2 n=1 Tax=Gigaspora margarita TaxID=4874 RepID=A0A8H3WUW9_GIGMA|nr:nuclear transport factor 2 [Gigaspora margarita]